MTEIVEGTDMIIRIRYQSGKEEFTRPPEVAAGVKLSDEQWLLYADYVRSLHNEMRTVEVVRFTYIKREEVVR